MKEAELRGLLAETLNTLLNKVCYIRRQSQKK
jgi:hypothetical protein